MKMRSRTTSASAQQLGSSIARNSSRAKAMVKAKATARERTSKKDQNYLVAKTGTAPKGAVSVLNICCCLDVKRSTGCNRQIVEHTLDHFVQMFEVERLRKMIGKAGFAAV